VDLILGTPTPFVRAIGQWLSDPFCLVDVGCAYGVGPAWTGFGEKLHVIGFDPDATEIARLNAEQHSGIHEYFCAFVQTDQHHPFKIASGTEEALQRNPWARLAIHNWVNTRSRKDLPSADNLPLVEPQSITNLGVFLDARNIHTVDYIKLDVDGSDLELLHAFADHLSRLNVLGLGLEINYFGSHSPFCNTFHNIDRLMKSLGYELFDLSKRKYSADALPAPSRLHPYPAETKFGRVLQGDAFYARDVAAGGAWSASLSADKCLKSAALFSLMDLPDVAAQVLLFAGAKLDRSVVETGLDLLTKQAQLGRDRAWSYEEYISRYKNDDRYFRPGHADLDAADITTVNLVDIDWAIVDRHQAANSGCAATVDGFLANIGTERAASEVRIAFTQPGLGALRVTLTITVESGNVSLFMISTSGDVLDFRRSFTRSTSETVQITVDTTSVASLLITPDNMFEGSTFSVKFLEAYRVLGIHQ
jgi:hypothetical protein